MRKRVLGVSAVWPAIRCASVSSRACPRSLAVWRADSGRVASGIWPYGLWTLAAWRGLICARCPCPNGALGGRDVSHFISVLNQPAQTHCLLP